MLIIGRELECWQLIVKTVVSKVLDEIGERVVGKTQLNLQLYFLFQGRECLAMLRPVRSERIGVIPQ